MRRVLLLVLVLSGAALASDIWVGEIASTGASVTNATTATPFVLKTNARYTIQCDQNVNMAFGATGSTPVATTAIAKMFFLAARPTTYDICTYNNSLVWAVIPVTAATANCEVFQAPMLPGHCL